MARITVDLPEEVDMAIRQLQGRLIAKEGTKHTFGKTVVVILKAGLDTIQKEEADGLT